MLFHPTSQPLVCATAVVAAIALLGCSDAASPSTGSTNADLSPSHKHADGGGQGDDASAADAAAGDSATPDAQSDGAATDAQTQGDVGATDAGDGACPCGVVDPYECDQLTQKCAQNPSCSSCQLLSQVCACAPCDDGGGHHCH